MADPNTAPENKGSPQQDSALPPQIPAESSVKATDPLATGGVAEVSAAKPKRGALSHSAAIVGAGLTVGAMAVAGPTAAKLLPADSLVGDIAEAAGGVLIAGAAGAYATKKASDAFRNTPGKKHGIASGVIDATGAITVPVAALAGGTLAAGVGEMDGFGGNATEFGVGAGWAGLATAGVTKKVGDRFKKPVVEPGQGQGGGGETPLQAQGRRLLEDGAVIAGQVAGKTMDIAGKGWEKLKEGFEKGKGGDGPGKA